MEKLEKIREILDRFYKGETDLEEEEFLKGFFASGEVSEELLPDKDLFMSFDQESDSIAVPEGLNQKIISTIDRAEHQATRTRRISVFSMSGLAAGLLVMIAVYLFFVRTEQKPWMAANELTDTYQDPLDAYAEAKRTLAYVSSKLNTGTSGLQHVREVSKVSEPIQSLSKINKGTKELSLLGQLKRVRDMEQ